MVLAFFQVGLAWLPRHAHDEPDAAELGVTPRHALSRFLDLLKRILTAKNAHEEDLDTHRAKRDSGDNPGHTFRGTCRGCLREAKQKAFFALQSGYGLHSRMEAALKQDKHRGVHWRHDFGTDAYGLWSTWTRRQRTLYEEFSSGQLRQTYIAAKDEWGNTCTTAVAKRFRVGPPGRFPGYCCCGYC